MRRGRRIFVLGLVAALTVPVVYLLTREGSGEPLTKERLAAAEALWEERGPKSYALDVDLPGAHHHIEVKDGTVVTMTTDGNAAFQGALGHWSVEGMFGFLSEELSNVRRPDAAYGVSDPDEVLLRAAFDARYGFPARFLRHVRGQTTSFEWEARLTPR